MTKIMFMIDLFFKKYDKFLHFIKRNGPIFDNVKNYFILVSLSTTNTSNPFISYSTLFINTLLSKHTSPSLIPHLNHSPNSPHNHTMISILWKPEKLFDRSLLSCFRHSYCCQIQAPR